MKALLLLLLALPLRAQDQVFPLPLFKDGLHTRYSANVIPDGALSTALNVLLDEDVDGVVVARNGYSKYNTTAITDSKTVRGLWTFDATDGTKYMVAFSSQSFYKSAGNGTWTAITGLHGFSLTNDFDCTQAIGKLWCANGDVFFYWDGTSTAAVSGAPIGSLVGKFRNRVLLSGISGSKGRVRGSGELDGTDWTVQIPGVSTTPFNIAFGGADDGEDITCMMGTYQDVYIVGKRNSLWGLYGFGRTDFQVRELSREVGCIDRLSVREKNGCLYWLSLRGIEKYCGTSITRISDPIRDQIDTIVATAGNPRSAVDTSQTDFEAGNLTASGQLAAMSATITPGSVVPSSRSITTGGLNNSSWEMVDSDTTTTTTGFLDNFDDNNLTGNVVWTQRHGTVGVSDTRLSMSILTGGSSAYASTPEGSSTGTWSWVFYSSFTTSGSGETASMRVHFVSASTNAETSDSYFLNISPDASGNSAIELRHGKIGPAGNTLLGNSAHSGLNDGTNKIFRVTKSLGNFFTVYVDGQQKFTATSVANTSGGFFMVVIATTSNAGATGDPTRVHFDTVRFPPFYENQLSTPYDIGLSTPVYGAYTVGLTSSSLSSSTFATQTSTASIGGYSSLTSVDYGGNIASPDGKRFIRHSVSIAAPESAVTISSITSISLSAATTGYFVSQCRNPSTEISAWGLYSCNQTLGDGTLTHYISTGASCAAATSPTATLNAQTNNSVITVATSAYVAYRVLFGIDSGTQTPKILDCTINWTEGGSRPPVASSVYRDRYYLAYTSATSGSGNDHILVLDKNDKWTLFDGHSCYSLANYERKLYCGSSTDAGQVWRMDSGTDDDGTAIKSTIRTKAFNLGMPERRKSFTRLYLDLEPSPDTAQTITLTGRYTLERSTPLYSLGTVDLNEDAGSILTAKFPFPLANPTSARYLQIELESNSLNAPWRLFSGRLYYNLLDPE